MLSWRAKLLLVLLVGGTLLSLAASIDQQVAATETPITLPGCTDKCGNISIPFPFGMKQSRCFLPGFEVTCNDTFSPPRLFLGNYRQHLYNYQEFEEGYYSMTEDDHSFHLSSDKFLFMELISINLKEGVARAYGPVSSDCNLNETYHLPLSLDVRLDIAAESAEGLAYMHSKTTSTILHGDVKPANILLDDNFVPKISDFGISRLIAIDKKQHTDYIIGDKSYMDPVYLQTGLLTKKSDVYSFGVVLLELISRKKATYSDNNSLIRNFLNAQKEKRRATELFDNDITEKAEDLELLDNLVKIAVECLNLDVNQRPEMTDVEERLVILKRSRAR
uniref:Protein kinase domain-containing protein n=1 Tax=Leersia perrieri TaxID=77586 RepID=A0A0D9XI62_9ORYZ